MFRAKGKGRGGGGGRGGGRGRGGGGGGRGTGQNPSRMQLLKPEAKVVLPKGAKMSLNSRYGLFLLVFLLNGVTTSSLTC